MESLEETDQGWFTFNEETNTIEKYSTDESAPEDIFIPQRIRGKEVLHIGNGSSVFSSNHIKMITIPEWVQSIADYAITVLCNLIMIPSTVVHIGEHALYSTMEGDPFDPMKYMVMVNQREGEIKGAPWGNFHYGIICNDTIIFKDFVYSQDREGVSEYLGDEAHVKIPSQFCIGDFCVPVKRIERGMFFGQRVKRITIFAGVEEIDEKAFENCLYLQEIRLPDGLKIGKG